MKTSLLAFVAFVALPLLLTATGRAQSDEEMKFRTTQAKKLVAFADKAFKKGFPRKAKLVYLMVLAEYDEDNEAAHEALGHARVGTSWGPTPGFRYPTDDKPDASAANSLRRDYDKLAEDLVRAHKGMARSYEKSGRTDMALYHYQRILRFVPDDPDAKDKLELVDVGDGLSGTALEQTLYERGIAIEDAVKQEAVKDYVVETLPETDRHPLLEKAKVDYVSVRSDHFVLRGDFDEDILKEGAVWAERAYEVIKAAYAGHENMFLADTTKWGATQYAFFKTKETYVQILHANRDLIKDQARFDFMVEHTGGCGLGDLVIGIAAGRNNVLDRAVRVVAQSYSVLPADALTEGIGHTFVGMMLRNNRTFLVDRQEQLRTQTGEEDIDEFNPDMDLWMDLAVEQAWKKTTVPAVQLPLIHGSKFDDEMRIKAWSFCHYLVLRDPSLLRHLDACRVLKSPVEIEKKFQERTGVSLAALDKEWQDFFTGATPVLRAIENRTDPMTVVSRDVKKWLDAINQIRTEEFHAAPVNWSASFSTRCKEHADYLRAHELSGPVEEQRENPELPDSTHAGNMFAQMAMVSTHAKSPKAVIEEWLRYPGYRDVFFVDTLKTIGIYAEKDIVVLNVVQGLVKPHRFAFFLYPNNGATRIPNEVPVEELGPELVALLAEHGHPDRKTVGFPLSLHFGNTRRMAKRDSIRCKVTVNDRETAGGFLHIADDGTNRRTASPGLVVFYPVPPIRKGAKVKVEWTFEHGNRLEKFDATFTH